MKFTMGLATLILGVAVVGFAYGHAESSGGKSCPGCSDDIEPSSQPTTGKTAYLPGDASVIYLDVAESQPTTAKAVDAGNTLCLSGMGEKVKPGVDATYKGKIYHFCCKDCIEDFDKNPEKYVKDLEEHPDKYGVKK